MNILVEWYPGDAIAFTCLEVLGMVAVLVALAWAAEHLLARRHAALRSGLWLSALIGVLLTPALALVGSRLPWHVSIFPAEWAASGKPSDATTPFFPSSVPPARAAKSQEPDEEIPTTKRSTLVPAPAPVPATPATVADGNATAPPSLVRALATLGMVVWGLGSLLLLARMMLGWWAIRRLRGRLRPLDDERWVAEVSAVARVLSVARLPIISLSPVVRSPVVIGLLSPRVVLPESLPEQCTSQQMHDILVHECAHVMRGDAWVRLLQSVAGVLFWIHPFVRFLNRQLDKAREDVCDNHVLARDDAPAYAETLLKVARICYPNPELKGYLTMIPHHHHLERRVAGLLEANRDRSTRLPRRQRAVLLASLLLILGVVGSFGPDSAANAVDTKQEFGGYAVTSQEIGKERKAIPVLATQQRQPASLLPAEIVAAWVKAGAQVGWMGDQSDNFFVPLDGLRGEGREAEVPAFEFKKWQPGVIGKLPQPERAFGLSLLHVNELTDSHLKELAGLKSLRTLGLFGTQVTDAGLKELAGLQSLQSLYLLNTRVTGAGLKELAGLRELRRLYLGGRQVTDAGLAGLAGLKSLQSLVLVDTQVTAAGLKELAGLQSLQSLTLEGTTDAGLKELASLKDYARLKSLDLIKTQVTDTGLKELADLKSLERLGLIDSQVTDAGLKELTGLKSLQSLGLSSTQVTDAGLKELSGLKELQELRLGGTKVTDAGLKELAGLKSLKLLHLYRTGVTDAGLKELQVLRLGQGSITDVGLKELAGLNKLQELGLSSTQVTDAGLKELTGLKELQTLRLDNTKVTDAGTAELRKALPGVYIQR